MQDLDRIGSLAVADSAVDEEQEREVSHEIERERQIQRPPTLLPRKEAISRGLTTFIATGEVFVHANEKISYAFELFEQTSATSCVGADAIKPPWFTLMMMDNYKHSVQLPTQFRLDQYLRPANWVISGIDSGDMIVISPFDANALLPSIRASAKVSLHTYAARVTRTMVPFDKLDFYTMTAAPGPRDIPISMIQSLNVFAGTLYLASTDAADGLCGFLGVFNRRSLFDSALDFRAEVDGFISEESRRDPDWPWFSPFKRSPLPYFKTVLTLRMRGQDYGHTHMGYIVSGRVIREEIIR